MAKITTEMNRNTLITIAGFILAGLNAWINVDWSTFQFDFNHIMPLVVSFAIGALGWYLKLPATKRRKNETTTNP